MSEDTGSETAAKKKPAPLWAQILSGVVGGYVMISIMTCSNDKPASGSAAVAAEPFGASHSGALTLCQMALKRASRDPATAEVPYVNDQGGRSEYYFVWNNGTKPVRMKNGYGALLSGSASCTVDKRTGQITSLSLDGKTIL